MQACPAISGADLTCNSMGQSPYQEADSHPASEEICHLLCNSGSLPRLQEATTGL
jgi:hypothetical protein